MKSVFTKVAATPIWLTAMMMPKPQMAAFAMLATKLGLLNPACALAPRRSAERCTVSLKKKRWKLGESQSRITQLQKDGNLPTGRTFEEAR
jgi:hypothetical protein